MVNKQQSKEINNLYDWFHHENINTFSTKRKIKNELFEILKRHNPNVDDKKVNFMVLELEYILIHNYTDNQEKQFKDMENVLDD